MTYRPASAVEFICIHYTATVVGGPPINMAIIDSWHRQRGYKEAGYHFLIRLDGSIEAGREIRPDGSFEQGAHSRGENAESIGVCYEGGLLPGDANKGVDTRTDAQKAAMVQLLTRLTKLYPKAKVEGHRDMPGAATQCPGFDAAAWWASAKVSPDPTAPPLLDTVIPDEETRLRWRLAQIRDYASDALAGK